MRSPEDRPLFAVAVLALIGAIALILCAIFNLFG